MKEKVNKKNQSDNDYKPYEKFSFFMLKDLQIFIFYLVIAPLSWIASERIWRLFCILIGFFVSFFHFKRTFLRTKEILRVCETTWKNMKYSLLEIQIVSGSIEPHFQYIREYRPGAWKKSI